MATELASERPWILLPGTLCSGAVFGPFLDALGVPDALRHTVALRHASIDDYLPDLKATCVPGAILCGFSLGAIVAAHLADRLPISEVILFALNPHADPPKKRPERLALARDVVAMGGAAALAPRLSELAGKNPVQARTTLLSMADQTAGDIAAQTELASSRPGALGSLSRTMVPVTFLTGTCDTMTPLDLAQQAARAAPNSRVIALHGLGHFALLEDPDRCSRAMTQPNDEDGANFP